MLLPQHLTPFARPSPTFHVYECAGCKAREEVATHPLLPPSDTDGHGCRLPIHGWVALSVIGAVVPAVLCPTCGEKALPVGLYRAMIAAGGGFDGELLGMAA